MTAKLIPYVGKTFPGPTKLAGRPPGLSTFLNETSRRTALMLFRSGFDSLDIARRLSCTPAAAANGLALAREEGRA